MGWIRTNWPAAIGYAVLFYQAVKFVIGLLGDIDFILSRFADPGWVGAMIGFVLDPPQWFNISLIATGLALIYWNAKRHPALSEIGMSNGRGQAREILSEPEWKTKIPNLCAAKSAEVRRLFDGPERHQIVALLRSGDIFSWAREKERIDFRQLEARLWHIYEMEIVEVNGELQSLFRHPSEQRNPRPWDIIPSMPELTRIYDVHFNETQLRSYWPELFK